MMGIVPTPALGSQTPGRLMRFDADQAAALADQFDSLRLAGGAGARQAADRVAEALERAGLRVERARAPGPPEAADEAAAVEVWPAAVVAVLAGLGLEIGILTGRAESGPFTLAAIFALIVLVALAGRLVRRRLGGAARGSAESVHAERPGQASAPARVVFLTHLDTRPTPEAQRFRRLVGALDWGWLGLLWLPCLVVGGAAWLERAGPGLLVALGLLAAVRQLDPWVRSRAPYPADNRTGLAVLLELARSWSAAAPARIEAHFLAVGAPIRPWDQAGWADRLRSWPRKPTLVVNLDAPGLGPALLLDGQGEALRLALAAARDLWLPHRAADLRAVPLDHRACAAAGLPAIGIVGDLDATAIDRPLLAAAGQLAVELALRWSRRAEGPDTAGSANETAARQTEP